MKRCLTALLCALILGLFAPVVKTWAATYPDPTAEFYVADFANVLTASTRDGIVRSNDSLFAKNGAQVVVVTVKSTQGVSTGDYALKLFNSWGVGDVSRNNGLLLLLSIEDDDYWVVTGSGVDRAIGDGRVVTMVQDNLEDYFAVGDYDAGVSKTFNALYNAASSAWSAYPADERPQAAFDGNGYVADRGRADNFYGVFGFIGDIFTYLIIALIIIVVIAIFARPRRYGYGGGPVVYVPWYRRPWFGGYHHHHHHHHGGHMPPPPPRMGGWGAPPSSSRGGGRPSSSGGMFGGNAPRTGGGGMSRGGGGGRTSTGGFGNIGGGGRSGGGFGGGGRSGGGGMSRGGGGGRKR